MLPPSGFYAGFAMTGACQHHYQAWLSDPDYALTKATSTEASFGCIWCGGDLTQGTIWLDRESLADLKLALSR